MPEFFAKLFDTSDFSARWQCGNWTEGHGWLHIVSDLAVFGAYASIPLLLVFFVLNRRDAPFLPVFWLFAVFILSCGIGHLVEATIFWHPWYRLSGVVKCITAVVSWATVIALVPALPKALSLPGLSAINQKLEREIEVRKQVELTLRERAADLTRTNQDLERYAQMVDGREQRVVELKEEVNQLLSELGRELRYQVDRSQTDAT